MLAGLKTCLKTSKSDVVLVFEEDEELFEVDFDDEGLEDEALEDEPLEDELVLAAVSPSEGSKAKTMS